MSSLPVLFATFYLLILIFVLWLLDIKFYLPSLSGPLLARVVDDPISSVVEPQWHNPVWWLWKIYRTRVQKNAGTLKNYVWWLWKTRLTYNCAHLRSTKECLTIWVKIFLVKIFEVKTFLSENFLGEIFLGENCFWWKF